MKRPVLAATLLLLAGTAHADGEPGWLAGLAASFGSVDTFDDTIDDSSLGAKLTGQYRFNGWFGVEGAFVTTGDFGENTAPLTGSGFAEVAASGFSFSGILYIPIPLPDAEIYTRAGFFDFDVDATLDDALVANGSEDGLNLGAGLVINISERFGIRAEFDWYDTESFDYWAANIGGIYRFGFGAP